MRVLFIAPLPEPITGQSLACQVFLDALRAEHDVDVIDTKRKTLRNAGSFQRIGEVLSFAWRTWRKSRACDGVYIAISQSVVGNLKDLLIYLANFRLLPRTIIHLHGGPGMQRLLSEKHPVLRRLNEFFLRRIAGVIVLGRRHMPIFSPFVDPQKIHIVANFAQDGLFLTTGRVRQKFAAASPLRLLFLSNLNVGKGHDDLLAAVRLLRDETRAALEIDFAGGFESEADRRAFMETIEDLPEVHYHGIVHGDAKERLFAAANVFCLPTYYAYEGQPISILEAYAAGCAVITTDHSGIFDVFTPDVNGYVVEKRSAASIAAAIERAVADPIEALAFALKNLEQAIQLYRVETYSSGLLRIMDSILAPTVQ